MIRVGTVCRDRGSGATAMVTVAWILGAVVLVGGAVTPLLMSGRRGRRRDLISARDRARSLISQLESALDRATDGTEDAAVAEGQRCLTLAGAALAGTDETPDDFAQAAEWAQQGLRALGVSR